MNQSKEQIIYPRLLESVLRHKLNLFGAVVVEGPKQSGKTYLCEQVAKSKFYVQKRHQMIQLDLSLNNTDKILNGSKPRLIDEWQIESRIWDLVRFKIDQAKGQKGLYILTGSSNQAYQEVYHSGAGRFAWLQLQTLTFYELLSKQSQQKFVSLQALFEQKSITFSASKVKNEWTIKQMLKGGWPEINQPETQNYSQEIISSYLKAITNVTKDNQFSELKINPLFIKPFIKSLVWLNAKQIGIDTIANNLELDLKPAQIKHYLLYLQSMFICFELQIWNHTLGLIKRQRLRVKPKHYLCDPSILFNVLNLHTVEKILEQTEILGYAFENQVIKDLTVDMQNLNGQLSFYRDENGLEVDAIIELNNGQWAAIEIKWNGMQKNLAKAIKTLQRFNSKMTSLGLTRPAFMAIIVLNNEINRPYRRADGIYVIPHVCLGP